ncbi:MAG: patatin-like phospholipase family protein, partial [Acidobacteriota bacterium]|nr:patatin-like phospholipase family protein [Acidobacteriota bacterium]
MDRPIGDYFDLIAGTSTGGIIALGFGLGFSAEELSQFYAELGSQIFSGKRWRLALRQVRRAKYTQESLRRALESKFAGKKIGDSKTRLVIPSMNVDTGKVYIFKTAHHPHLETDYKKEALEAALATTAAPTFFPAHLADSGVPLIDGGMWANNPVGLAVVEAIGILGWSKEDLR